MYKTETELKIDRRKCSDYFFKNLNLEKFFEAFNSIQLREPKS